MCVDWYVNGKKTANLSLVRIIIETQAKNMFDLRFNFPAQPQ